jgi:hypothetical protein
MKICLRPLQFRNVFVQKVTGLIEERFNIKPATHWTNRANWANCSKKSVPSGRPNFTGRTGIAALTR